MINSKIEGFFLSWMSLLFTRKLSEYECQIYTYLFVLHRLNSNHVISLSKLSSSRKLLSKKK